MSSRKKARFELGRRNINPGLEHAVKIFFEPLAIAHHGVSKVMNGLRGEITAEHRATAIELYWNTGRFGRIAQARFELRTDCLELVVRIGCLQFFERRDSGSH